MAMLESKDKELLKPLLGPHFLEDKIRTDIQICWIMQSQENRNATSIRDMIIAVIDEQLKDIQNIVEGL